MVLDHVNATFYSRELGFVADALGRISMPLFGLVCAYNLARPHADYDRSLRRLVGVGLLAAVPHWLLFGMIGPWPLNILFTFAVAVWVVRELDAGRTPTAVAGFIVAGALVEYWWPGVALVVAGVYVFRKATPARMLALALAFAGLCAVNGNPWAVLAMPLLLALSRLPLAVPRAGRFFLLFYPAHLAAFAAVLVLVP